MLKQTIVWTALPHGIDGAPDPGATVRLSAFVAPRLWNDDGTPLMQLSQFPDFLDWPNVIQELDLQGPVRWRADPRRHGRVGRSRLRRCGRRCSRPIPT